MGNLGWTEILIILVIALIIFGPRKLPELGKSLGQSLAQFRKASDDFKRTWEQEVEVEKQHMENLALADTYPDANDYAAKEETAAVSLDKEPAADESIEEAPASVARGSNVTGETRRDWM